MADEKRVTPANENQLDLPNLGLYRRTLFRTFRLLDIPMKDPLYQDASGGEIWLGVPAAIQFPFNNPPPASSAPLTVANSDMGAVETADLFNDWLRGLEALKGTTNVPPPTAEFILGFLIRGPHREAMLGDLKEKFAHDCKQFGGRKASRRYWVETLQSILPLLFRG